MVHAQCAGVGFSGSHHSAWPQRWGLSVFSAVAGIAVTVIAVTGIAVAVIAVASIAVL